MKFTYDGNAKVGTRVITHSRPVGDTCPPDCRFLGNQCYQETTEKLRPNVRSAAMENVITDHGRLRAMFLYAASAGQDVRLLVGGDFMIRGEFDTEFCDSIRWACESITSRGGSLPKIWLYSHVIDSRVASLGALGISVYASVHSAADVRKAKRAGFKLFALADVDEKHLPKAPRRSAEKVAAWRKGLPRWVELAGERFLVCPEQRRGRGVVSCSGSPESLRCGWCVAGRGSVAFAKH